MCGVAASWSAGRAAPHRRIPLRPSIGFANGKAESSKRFSRVDDSSLSNRILRAFSLKNAAVFRIEAQPMKTEWESEMVGIRPYRPGDVPALLEAVQESMKELHQWMPWCHPEYNI